MEKTLAHKGLRQVANSLTLLCALILIVAVSVEIISGDHLVFSPAYMTLQLIVCCIFLFDWFLRLGASERPGRFFWTHLIFLLLSIPWLNIADWSDHAFTRSEMMALATVPLLRSFLALYVVVRWMVEGKAERLFWAYIVTVVVFTYLSALLFYDYEILVNDRLHGFGNALWWAWMNVTTVGAAIFPVTTVGKIICVLLPILGMAMFPIFTVYVTTLYTDYTRRKQEGK